MAASGTATLPDEYRALTQGCALLDRSERGKLALTGPDAVEFLNGQVTNELADLQPGEGRYAAFLTHKGKMLGDLRILATDDELLLDTERVALQALFDMIRRFKVGYDVELHKRTLETGLVSLIGPASRAIAEGAFHARNPLPTHEHEHAQMGAVRMIATDVGIDVLCDAAATTGVMDVLAKTGAVPISDEVAEIVRVERGTPRYGIDLDESTIPQEAGLNERAVSFTKGCYVGQETVARLFYKGKPNRVLRGLRLSEPVPAGAELLLGDRVVGTLTSSILSPTFGPIGLALVRVAAQPPATLAVAGSEACATLVELPFG